MAVFIQKRILKTNYPVTCDHKSLQETVGCFSFCPKFRKFLRVRNQMERIISVRSDRNIWEHLWKWSNLIGPTGFLSICQIVIPSTLVSWKMIPYSRPKRSDLYTLHRGTYLYRPYMAGPPPPPRASTALRCPPYKNDNQTLGTLNWVVIYRFFRGTWNF